MSAEEHKAEIRHEIEFLNSPNWADSVPDDAPWKQEHLAFRTAFPDYHFTAEHIVAESNIVMVWGTVRATHAAEFPVAELKGITATRKQLTWTEVWLIRYENGEQVEHRLLVDALGRLQQLGAYPTAESST